MGKAYSVEKHEQVFHSQGYTKETGEQKTVELRIQGMFKEVGGDVCRRDN